MTLNKILLLFLLTVFTSCIGNEIKTTEHITQATRSIGDTVSHIGKNIRSIFQDNQNNYWFASDDEGVFKYDGKTIIQFTEKSGLCGNSVRLIQQDTYGTIIISTGDQTCSFDGKQFNQCESASHYSNPAVKDNSILLFGKYYQDKLLYMFQLPQTSKLTKSSSQTPYEVYCSYKDNKGNIWFGTESRGVCKYDGNIFTWLDNEDLGLTIRAIFEDKDGNIWIGNNGNGLFRYDGKVLTHFTKEQNLENPNFHTTLQGKEGTLARVWSIADDKNGNLWIATIDAGVWKFDGKTLINYTKKDGLASNSISTVFCDDKGNIWIGADNGITIYDGKKFKTFDGQH